MQLCFGISAYFSHWKVSGAAVPAWLPGNTISNLATKQNRLGDDSYFYCKTSIPWCTLCADVRATFKALLMDLKKYGACSKKVQDHLDTALPTPAQSSSDLNFCSVLPLSELYSPKFIYF